MPRIFLCCAGVCMLLGCAVVREETAVDPYGETNAGVRKETAVNPYGETAVGVYAEAAVRAKQLLENHADVVAHLRDGLRNHSRRITIRFANAASLLDELPDIAGALTEEALEETGAPTEGDYIRYQCGGYKFICEAAAGDAGYLYTISVVPDYYMYLAQEEQVTEKLRGIMDGFGFEETTPAEEKIRTIYDYVCQTIRYDNVHRDNPYHRLRSTSYAGVIWGAATCQGYCVTLYRMLREAGIDCRIVTGTGYAEAREAFASRTETIEPLASRTEAQEPFASRTEAQEPFVSRTEAPPAGREEFHAWNIVSLDGMYYALDATWDAGREEYRYFLKGTADFEDHKPDEAFLTEDFLSAYPQAERSYAP